MMMEIKHLPAEMLLMVHRRLLPNALKKAVLVDRRWRALGEDPSLWDWCKVTVYSKEDIENLAIKRLQRIQEITINPGNWDAGDWEAFLWAVEGLSSLKRIYGPGLWPNWGPSGIDNWGPSGIDLVETGLFSRSLAKLEDVTVRASTSYDRIHALFTEMSNGTKVKTFHLWSNNLTQMEPALFARVLSRVENLQFCSNFTKDQVQAFFTELLNNCKLKKLYWWMEDIWSYLEPGLSSRVLSKIEDVFLSDYADGVSSAHLEALFTEPSFGTRLKRLYLSGNNLVDIDTALLAKALSRLEELRLEYTPISADQIEALFIQISLQTQMKKLTFEAIDLSQLDEGLFARVMVRLEEVFLSDCDTPQMLEFFTEMSRTSHMKSLNFGGVDLSSIDPEVLAKGLSRVEAVSLCDIAMASDQVMSLSLFSEMSQNTAIKKIDLRGNILDLSSVDPEVLVRALTRLEEVRLTTTSITHDQAKAFFTGMSQNTQLKKLELFGGDFSGVDPVVLATAVAKVYEVSLNCDLSADQVTGILTRVLESEKKLRKLNLSYVGGTEAIINPEIVSKVQDKLKGKLNLTLNS